MSAQPVREAAGTARSGLAALPPCATTGVGSLPLEDVGRAVDHACGAYDVPFCPQLPELDGDMVREWLGADPARCGWSADRDRERPRAWDGFLERMRSRPPAHGVVKLQATGPLTLAMALEAPDGNGARPEVVRLAVEVAAWLATNVAGQVRALTERGLLPVLVVDEPALQAVAPSALDATRAWDPLRVVSPCWGLHVCCAVPWPLVDRAEPDVVSFDLARHGLDSRATASVARLLRRGSRIAWGAVAVDGSRGEGPADGARRLAGAVAALRDHGIDPEAALAGSLLTPACGTGPATPDRERRIASTLRTVAHAGRAFGVRA